MHLFLGATTKGWKESTRFPDSELYTEYFEKKFINKIKYSTSLPDPDFLGVTFADFGTLSELRKIKIGRFEAEGLVVTGENIFDYLKRKDF